MRLEVDDVTQSGEVSAEAPALATETSDLGANFSDNNQGNPSNLKYGDLLTLIITNT
jgi:hypothetical protein